MDQMAPLNVRRIGGGREEMRKGEELIEGRKEGRKKRSKGEREEGKAG